MKIGRKKLTVASTVLFGLSCTFGAAGWLAAQEETDASSECIACHTDLEQMDVFGAASASSSAGIAG